MIGHSLTLNNKSAELPKCQKKIQMLTNNAKEVQATQPLTF